MHDAPPRLDADEGTGGLAKAAVILAVVALQLGATVYLTGSSLPPVGVIGWLVITHTACLGVGLVVGGSLSRRQERRELSRAARRSRRPGHRA